MKVAGDRRYHLETLRRFAPHTLSEPEERVINLKNVNGSAALVTLYQTITGGFSYPIEIDGETRTLSRSELMDFARDASADLRKAAYASLLGVYECRRDELAQIYQHLVADWREEHIVLRGHASPISVRNLDSDVPDEVVASLLETCRENVAPFQRYFRLKAKRLGLERLRRFDLLAPLEHQADEIPFAVGVELVLRSFRGFSPRLADLAERVLAEGHLDSIPRAGKRGGALSWDALPGRTPWVLMSYSGDVSDVTTLAHELGHAVHALMAAEHSVLTFSPPLPLAETASSFAQLLLLEAMLEDAEPRRRQGLLAKYVDDSYAQILRPAFRVLFEQEAHRMIAEGATAEELSAAYMGSLHEQFGDSVEVDDLFADEWVSLPHFYTMPFYDYAYALGMLLVLALYRRYQQQGEAFVPAYLAILAYGGSKSPIAILDEAGFDIRSKTFWQGGFDLLSDMVDELESVG